VPASTLDDSTLASVERAVDGARRVVRGRHTLARRSAIMNDSLTVCQKVY
jgi:hypothetical protein